MYKTSPPEPKKAKKKPWEMIFFPETFEKAQGELRMADYRLTQEELSEKAIICSKLRGQVKGLAL